MKKLFVAVAALAFVPAFAQMEVSIMDLTTNDLVYDAVTNRIYASIPSANGSNGNSIGVINPATHTLENTVFIGSEPSVLAITDNGQYIYAGFEGSATVRRFDVASQSAGLQFPLGSDSFLGQYYAADIEAVPGQPEAIAISRKYTTVIPEFAGVAVYDNGVARANAVMRTGGEISNKIEFKNSTTLFGYNNETTGFDFNRMSVNAGGVTLVNSYGNTPSGSSFYMDFTYAANKAFFTDGSVVDVTSTPFVIGRFTDAIGPAAYDALINKVCYASSSNGAVTFKRFNPDTFLLQDSLPINDAFGTATSIITCGPGYYAFNTSDNKVVIINDTSIVAATPSFNKNDITLYPNPASNYIKIASEPGIDIQKAVVYTINGAMVYEGAPQDNMINISNFAPGVYLLQLTDNNNNSYAKKIVKQ